ncbi:hypothetical protein [Gracilimonas mengyeensis]|uniref:Uncharacterized protein n=1 Tax=Gracilimonas mengyeensis TaxID=1302730 RepID=A0A521B055_9BACT|nr:hypothetical protein [Gracilimonas mengyeensis]SMO40477.1 hypothetical protein SAMN06265219_101484 [Gracilimonas mengyeensis]
MSETIEKALKEFSNLADDEKESFAAFILEEMKSEERWNELYKSSQKTLTNVAEEALKEYDAGKTDKLDTNKL